MDREKVIKSLKWFRDRDSWREGIMIHDDHADVRKQICDDALALLKEQSGLMLALDQSNAVNGYLNAEVERLNGLLKEQEPVKPRYIPPKSIYSWECGVCAEPFDRIANYCPKCGRRVKWE